MTDEIKENPQPTGIPYADLPPDLEEFGARLEQMMNPEPEDHAALFKALAVAQGAITAAEALQTADAGSYSYRYADLAACLEVIRKPLSDNGLALIQLPSINENGRDGNTVTIETILAHESGQSISCTMSMRPDKGGPQAVGAVMTYLRRYSLSSMLGVAQYDDDAASATKGPDEYDRLTPRDIDEILQKADELFAEKADFVIEQMTTMVFNVKHLADVPADQLKTALNRLQNTAKREAKKATDTEKAKAKPKPKPKPAAKEEQPPDREPGSDDE